MATSEKESTVVNPSSVVSMTTSREQRLQQDKAKLYLCCKSCSFLSVKTSNESSITIEFTSGEKKVEYTLLHSSDYPSNTIVTNSTDPGAVKPYDVPLTNILYDISKGWCKDHELVLPIEIESLHSPTTSTAVPTSLDTQISVASSVASSELTDFSEEEDYFDDYDGEDDSSIVHPLIYKDIEIIAKLYGETSIEQKVHAGINEMDVLLYIDMGFLDIHTASAWGVDSDMPIVLHIHFQSVSDYLDGPEPKIEIYQSSQDSKEKRKFGLGVQIQKIVETFISNRWKSTSNYHLEQEYEKVTPRKQLSSLTTPTNTPPSSQGYPPNIQQLINMGFPSSRAEEAMLLCDNDIERSIHLLTTGELLEHDEVDTDEPKTKTFPSLGRQDSQGAKAVLSLSDNLEEVKKAPSLSNGFLAQVMKYTLNRIPSLNEFCVICDEKHVLETGLLRPCVCTRELCVFAFQTLGVMADAAESVATDADVVDLMLAMCNAAANSSRASIILDPYPSLVDPSNSQRLAMDPSHKNFDQVKTVMSAIITGRNELLRGRCSHSSLKAVLDSHHILAFPLMQWVVATNRAYIVLLPEERKLKSMQTNYQFLLISSPPAKEAAFQEAKKKHGSTFAFHGSNIENWHSIMRKGLINASGTKLQLHGAAYGNGIYLSPNAGTSFGYSNRFSGNTKESHDGLNKTLAGKLSLTCIALCEVVTTKDLKRSGDIWVCPNSDHVVTRFFFVYDSQTHNQAMNLHTQKDQNFKQEISRAIDLAQRLKQKQ